MFIPYKAKIKVTRIPVMTITVVVLCLLIYWAQDRNTTRILEFAESFCTEEVTRDVMRGQKLVAPQGGFDCKDMLAHLYLESDSEHHLRWHIDEIEQKDDKEAAELLAQHFRNFVAHAPTNRTAALIRHSGSWNPVRFLSSRVAHASWDHVIGNLFFFIAFAMVVETVIGPVLFLLVFLSMSIGAGALQNLLTETREGATSLGLSGIVMGFMTLAAYLAPKVKIKFFYFFFFLFGVLSWPLWSVALWFVFWNLWDYHLWRDWSNIGYVAHLTGAVMGLVIGLVFFRKKRHWVTEHLVPDEPGINDEESWLYKLNIFGATPVVMFFVFFYGLMALVLSVYLIVTFFETFAVQLLIGAPIIAAMIQLYRLKQPKKTDWQRLQEGLAYFNNHQFPLAIKSLLPLAESGYPRGQFALGRLYATATGATRNDTEAMRWFEAAAKRGLPEAQHETGVRYYHGMGANKDLDRAIEWLDQAASKGLPEAASTLAYVYENAPKGKADKEKAMEWYYKAGVGYYKAGKLDDARSMLQALQVLAAKYPAVMQLVTELENLVEFRGKRR